MTRVGQSARVVGIITDISLIPVTNSTRDRVRYAHLSRLSGRPTSERDDMRIGFRATRLAAALSLITWLEHFRFLCSRAVAAVPDVMRAFVGHE
jgi:hypothetical protein